jgi:DNA invertase Pin-like site-specific DNA recombinase
VGRWATATSWAKSPPTQELFAKALERVRRGILALKLDRLSRRTRDVLDLVDDCRKRGWRLISVSEQLDTGSAAGRLVVTVLAALAEMEREQVSERTRFALDAVARKGRARSRFVPFGYRTGDGAPEQTKGDRRPLVPHEGEQRVLHRIRELREAGHGARRIARALQAEGISNPRSGRPWTPPNVGTLLRTMERRAEALA